MLAIPSAWRVAPSGDCSKSEIKGAVIFRTIYFLPTICSGVAIFMLWRLIYNPNFGLLNTMIAQIGELIGSSLSGRTG